MKNQLREAGFTLLEVIIAMAIMSIVTLAASRFLTSVVNQYAKDNKDIKLQTEVEEILNLMENVIMSADSVEIYEDLSGKTAQNTGSVIRVNQLSDSGSSSVEEYDLIFVDDGNMYESRYDGAGKNIGSHERIYMGTHVQSVQFTLSESGSAVFADVSMAYGGVTYDASRKILLRNLTTDYQSTAVSQTTAAEASTTEAGSGVITQPETSTEEEPTAEETTTAETPTAEEETTTVQETTTAEEITTTQQTTTAEETTATQQTTTEQETTTVQQTTTAQETPTESGTSSGSGSTSGGDSSTGGDAQVGNDSQVDDGAQAADLAKLTDFQLTKNQDYESWKSAVQIYYNSGWINGAYGPMYEYRFRLSNSETDIDWSKISVKFYIHMDETKITGGCIPWVQLGSGLTATAQYVTKTIHDANFIGTMSGFTASTINSDIIVYFYANGQWDAYDSDTYSNSLEKIEVYYGDTLIWPKS